MENGKSIGTVIGEALRPSQPDILGALRESIRELDGEIAEEEGRLDDLRARRFDLFAEEDRIRGDLLAMEYHRAEAALRRDRNPETTQAVHVAFCRYMAAMHLRNGTVPEPGPLAADIEAEMDRLAAATPSGRTAEAVLAVIRQRGPSAGRDVMSVLGGLGWAYPILRQLERDGVLRSWEEPGGPERDGRPRRLYDLAERIVQ